jgi:hypothetical protein
VNDNKPSGEPESIEFEPLDPATEAALDTLKEKLDRPPGWIPQAGDKIAFRAMKWKTVEPRGDPKKRSEVLVGASSTGLVSVFAYPKQLKTKLIKPELSTQAEAEALPHDERLVQPGDLVAIEFVGKFDHPTNEGQTYGRYRVEISRPVTSGTGGGLTDDIPFR